ncbi:Soluble guanylate cyclase 88E [Fasciola gigantica]|uniref:Soluble guanylate cyclase 88E n=1 Tax=Fasciola gigantica TaxID=46835 RepID=A0A504Z050_FASGI|nr:Soluble guanylate cyclase 88E [Fasciola gigantica]
MYGLLLANFKSYILDTFSEACWHEMVNQTDSDTFDFELTRDYDEQLFPRLVTAAAKVTNNTEDEIKYGCGKSLKRLKSFILSEFSESVWNEVISLAESETFDFELKRNYEEQTFTRIIAAAANVTARTEDEIRYGMGRSFKDFFAFRESAQTIRVIGRYMRDFLNGLDNFHEFLRSTYPQMKPPSFFCMQESRSGITLQYQTIRSGMASFFIGWMEGMSQAYFDLEMKITIVLHANNIFELITIEAKALSGKFTAYVS